MRVGIVSSAIMAGALLASFGLTACSSGSASSAASGGGDSAAASAEASSDLLASMDPGVPTDAASGPDTSGDPVAAAAACAAINTRAADAMKGMTSENPDDWQLLSDELLTLSDGAEDPATGQALMSLAVAAAFTVNGLQSSEPLATAKGDFDTAWADMNTICTAAGTPLK